MDGFVEKFNRAIQMVGLHLQDQAQALQDLFQSHAAGFVFGFGPTFRVRGENHGASLGVEGCYVMCFRNATLRGMEYRASKPTETSENFEKIAIQEQKTRGSSGTIGLRRTGG
jgi:hypothetical protein